MQCGASLLHGGLLAMRYECGFMLSRLAAAFLAPAVQSAG